MHLGIRVFFAQVFLHIALSLSANAASFPCTTSTLSLSAQDGNLSDPSTWVGGAVPTDGNCVVVRHHVTLDSDLGTEGGAGLGWIRIENGGQFDSDCMAPHAIYFGSTGTDPIGSGNNLNPGADASMFGFFASFGMLNLSCPQPNNVTITSADESDSWYIHHTLGDYVSCTAISGNVCNGSTATNGAVLIVQNTMASHLGTAVAYFNGIDWDMTNGMTPVNSATISNNYISDLFQIVNGGSTLQPANWRVTGNWFDAPRPDPSQALIYLVSGPTGSVVTDNTVTNAQTASFLMYAPDGSSNTEVLRNAVLGSSTTPFGIVEIVAGSSNTIEFNLCVNPEPPGQTVNPCVAIAGSGMDNQTKVSFNIIQGGHAGISQITEDPLFAPTFSYNWISQWKEDAEAQGAIITRSGTITETYNVLVMENSDGLNAMIGDLAYSDLNCTASVGQDHNTIYAPSNPTGNPNINFLWGDGGTGPYTCVINSYARSNISYGGNLGYDNDNNDNTWNLSSGIEYGGAAVHHNLDFGATQASYVNVQTSPGFDNGSIPHPNYAQYGDLSVDPRFLDTTRRPAGWDAVCGGPGTDTDLFLNLARRSGFGGIMNPCYSIPALWGWIRRGWAPLNPALVGAGHDGTYIGAVQPVSMKP
jgi:hypothetical protein